MAETSPAKRGLLLQLFATFFKIGAFTFGGGWAMISIMERELVDNEDGSPVRISSTCSPWRNRCPVFWP